MKIKTDRINVKSAKSTFQFHSYFGVYSIMDIHSSEHWLSFYHSLMAIVIFSNRHIGKNR